MKKLGHYLCILMSMTFILASCSSDDNQRLPQIYIDQPFYTLAKGSIELKIKSDQAPLTDVFIPVLFGGTAVEGVDFTISEPSILLKAGETEATFTLTRIEENIGDENKELYVNLQKAPEGFSLGLMNYASVNLLNNNGIIMSFENSTGKVGFSADFSIKLTNMKGGVYKVKVATTFDIEVDESSTAIEGVHYEFVNGAQVVVPINKNKGSFSIKYLKKEEGKDKLILRLANKDGYAIGSNGTLTVTISGPDIFTGTWAFDKITNLDLFEMYGEDISKAPKGTPSDRITFEGDSYLEYTFTPDLSGDLKNYFGTSPRKITFKEEGNKIFQENNGANVKVSILEIPDVNVKFSTTHKDIRPALVGFRLITVDSKEVLECTLDDYEPQGEDFGAMIYEFMSSMEDAPLRIHFSKVE